MRRIWDAVAHAVTRRTGAVLGVAAVATAILAIGIPQLGFETSQDSLIGENSEVAVDNRAFQERFGGEPMLVLFTAEGDQRVESLFTPENLDRLRAADESLRDSGLFYAVQSPLTALQLAANQVGVGPQMFEAAIERADDPTDQAELEARLAAAATRLGDAIAAGTSAGIANPLSIENPAFVRFLLYEDEAETSIRPVLRDNFPDPQHALSIVRLQGNVDIAEMGEGADLVRATYDATDLEGFTTLATGPPVLLQDINDYLQGGMATLGALAVGVMLLVLFLVFRVRWRLLSLSIVVLGALWAFGIMGFLGIPLTLITISGLPILIGVGVDFSIQMHSRFEEEIDEDGLLQASMTRVMRRLAPPLLIAMSAAVVGFLALQLSEVPQIRDFGLMLAIGIAALFVAGITVPTAILSLRERRKPTPAGGGSAHGALESLVSRLSTLGNRAVAPMLALGVLVIVGGLAVEGQFTIQTDPERWVPQGGDTVTSLEALREGTGFSSELSLLVTAPDVLDDEVVAWMYEYGQRQATEHPDGIVRATSLPAIAQSVTGATPGAEEVELLLDGALDDPPSFDVAPRDIVATFVTPDRTAAAITFPIAPLSLDARADLLDAMIADIDPPAGVEAKPASIAVVGVELVDALEANRALITWMAVGAVALLLLLWFRSITKALLPLLPVLIAVGLSSLVVFVSGLELSPLTSVTGPLVIATCTEFSVLILARYIEEREGGRTPEQAVEHGAVRIGRAFTASGLTTVGGFGVLALSAFPLLRDFGILVGVNVLVALVTALVVLPPLLVWADRNPRIHGFAPGQSTEPPSPVVGGTEPRVPTPTGAGG